MARPRKFDREAVVEKATETFWTKGYAATSIQDLVESTGINRGSIYNAFRDKAGLFLAVLEHYAAQSPTQTVMQEAERGEPFDIITSMFNDLIDAAVRDDQKRGCLLTNTAIELPTLDSSVAERITGNMHQFETALERIILRGQAKGVMKKTRTARALARTVLAAANGLRVVAKVNPDRATLEDIRDGALAALR